MEFDSAGKLGAIGGAVLVLGESSNGQDSGLQNRVWGFESLLPCQDLEGREPLGSCTGKKDLWPRGR